MIFQCEAHPASLQKQCIAGIKLNLPLQTGLTGGPPCCNSVVFHSPRTGAGCWVTADAAEVAKLSDNVSNSVRKLRCRLVQYCCMLCTLHARVPWCRTGASS